MVDTPVAAGSQLFQIRQALSAIYGKKRFNPLTRVQAGQNCQPTLPRFCYEPGNGISMGSGQITGQNQPKGIRAKTKRSQNAGKRALNTVYIAKPGQVGQRGRDRPVSSQD